MLKFVCMALLVAATQALIQCPENACALVRCTQVENCEGKVSVAGGWCGCCDLCVVQIGRSLIIHFFVKVYITQD